MTEISKGLMMMMKRGETPRHQTSSNLDFTSMTKLEKARFAAKCRKKKEQNSSNTLDLNQIPEI